MRAEEVSILELLKQKPVSIVELDSPKGLSMEKFLKGAQALKDAGAAAITLADNSLAILRVSNLAAAIRVREEVGLTSLLHLACRDRNLLGLQSEIMGAGDARLSACAGADRRPGEGGRPSGRDFGLRPELAWPDQAAGGDESRREPCGAGR